MCPDKRCTISANSFCRNTHSCKNLPFSIHSACNKHSFIYATSLSSFNFFAIILEITKFEGKAKIRGVGWGGGGCGVGITSTYNTESVRVLFLDLSVKGSHKMNWRFIYRQRDSCLRPTV